MKFIVSTLVTIFLAYALGLYLPWWSVAVAGICCGLGIRQHAALSFLSSFLGVFLLWGLMSYLISINNDHILARRISVFILKSESPIGLIVITGFIGGMTAGLSSLTGNRFVNMLRK